jgi:hypothetical protein
MGTRERARQTSVSLGSQWWGGAQGSHGRKKVIGEAEAREGVGGRPAAQPNQS